MTKLIPIDFNGYSVLKRVHFTGFYVKEQNRLHFIKVFPQNIEYLHLGLKHLVKYKNKWLDLSFMIAVKLQMQ